MPPKKKGGKKKSEGGGDKKEGTDNTLEKFYNLYRKNLKNEHMNMPVAIRDKFNEIRDERNPGNLKQLILWDDFDSNKCRVLFDSMRLAFYKNLFEIRLFQTPVGDEGVRAICKYMTFNKVIICLELVNCNITQLGCEFLSTVVTPTHNGSLQHLKLDYNLIEDEGILKLADGLAINDTLGFLSLCYCEIGPYGARGLFDIVINQNSKLSRLDLTGNPLRDEGAALTLRGLTLSNSITQVNFTNTMIYGTKEVLESLDRLIQNNISISSLNFGQNQLDEEAGEFIRAVLTSTTEEGGKINTTLKEIVLSEKIPTDLISAINLALKQNTSRKKGKGKGKMGKKKKKR